MSAPELKKPRQYRFKGDGLECSEVFGSIAVPAGRERRLVVRGYDGEGRELYAGETTPDVEKGLNLQLRFAPEPLAAEKGSRSSTAARTRSPTG